MLAGMIGVALSTNPVKRIDENESAVFIFVSL